MSNGLERKALSISWRLEHLRFKSHKNAGSFAGRTKSTAIIKNEVKKVMEILYAKMCMNTIYSVFRIGIINK